MLKSKEMSNDSEDSNSISLHDSSAEDVIENRTIDAPKKFYVLIRFPRKKEIVYFSGILTNIKKSNDC